MTQGGDQSPIGPEPTDIDQRIIAPPDRPTTQVWAAYPPSPAAPLPIRPDAPPDPGSRKLAIAAWLVFLFSLITVAAVQQIGAAMAETAAAPDPTMTPAQRVGPPKMDDPFDITARLFTKFAHSGLGVKDSDKSMIQGQILQAAQSPPDKFRAAIIVAEALDRPEDAQRIITDLEKADAKLKAKHDAATQQAIDNAERARAAEEAAGSDSRTLATTEDLVKIAALKPTLEQQELDLDIALARKVWDQGPSTLSDQDRTRLTDRHGWYGLLLVTHGEPFTTGPRAKLVANAKWIIALMLGALAVFSTALIGGIIAASVMGYLVMQGKIKPHFVRPAPGGSVYLETIAVFVAGFLAFKLLLEPLLAAFIKDQSILMGVVLACQWLLLPIIFWPRLRGVPKAQWKRDIGLSPVPGRSVIREIGAGVFGYFAALPVLALAMAITVLIVFAKAMIESGGAMGEDGPPVAPSNPIAEMISQAPLWQLAMLFALATIWAPLVEECIFRGCLFRHLRSRMGVLAAALLSATAFAVMHGYAALLLLPVFTIGLVFAFIREWRGSIIPTITAHALHNATVLGLVGALFMILRG